MPQLQFIPLTLWLGYLVKQQHILHVFAGSIEHGLIGAAELGAFVESAGVYSRPIHEVFKHNQAANDPQRLQRIQNKRRVFQVLRDRQSSKNQSINQYRFLQ